LTLQQEPAVLSDVSVEKVLFDWRPAKYFCLGFVWIWLERISVKQFWTETIEDVKV